jgi:hypothetical protein
MATPQIEILDNFHSQFQSKTVLDPTLEEQFFVMALGEFELDLYELNYNDVDQEISEDLSRYEVNLLGQLMYKAYKKREKDRIMKLNNIVGRDIEMTGMGQSKQTAIKEYELILDEITDTINKIKNSSFY